MKKLRKRVFAAVLAALMLATAMPVTALYASAETGDIKDCICETSCTEDSINGDCSVCGAEGADLSECTGKEQGSVPETDTEDDNADTDTAECICETLCTEDSINGDCPVCGADGASLLDCKGKVSEENTGEQEDTGICKHHQEHDADCGYISKSEDRKGSPCTYECRICPIEDLIAALPDTVTADNAADVRGQLDRILDLYRELDEDEQEQIDLSRCYALQEALDNANAPVQAAEEITINNATVKTLTAEDGDCPGHTFTGTAQGTTIYVASGTHNVTFSNLKITQSAKVGVAPGATMNLTIEGTNTIQADYNLAGIYVPVGATLIINGTGSLNVSGNNNAGIGGAVYAPDESSSDGDPNCGTVEINGGTVAATGGSTAAGIGGGIDTEGNPGNGGKVTINGGTVTATGGSDSYYGGAGIGGSAGETASDPAGNGGTLTINGGTVNLTAGTHDPQYPAYGFGQGTGKAPGGTCELTLADASCLTLTEGTTLDPKGKYTINGDPTEDMIVVPEDLIYNGKAQELDGKIYIDDSKTGTGTYFNQTFTVNASADGWELQDLGEVVNAGEYTATFTKGDKSISKTFTVAQSGTDLADGKVKTYNGETETTSFTAGDTITVKATPTATGTTPQKAAARLQGGPNAGQMALYVGDMLVSSEAVDADANGIYTMNVSAADVLTLGGVKPNGNAITLTAKFVGNDNMAGAEGTVKVNISAVAKVTAGDITSYYDNFQNAWSAAQRARTATVTLLADVTLPNEKYVAVAGQQNITLNSPDGEKFTLSGNNSRIIYVLGGFLNVEDVTVENTNTQYMGNSAIHVANMGSPQITIGKGATVTGRSGIDQAGGTLTLTVSGTVEGTPVSGIGISFNSGTLTVEKGAKISGGSSGIGINQQGGSLIINGGTISGGNGVGIYNASVRLNDGTFTGTKEDGGAISTSGSSSQSLGDLLDIGNAIFKADGTTVERTETSTGPGTFTVKECQHTGVEVTDLGEGKHGLTCPYCGYSCSHDTILTATTSDTVITVNKGCETDGCGYSEKLGTVSVTFENLVYRDSEARVSWTKDGPAASGVALKIDNADDYAIQCEVTEYSCSLTDLFGSTPVTAGDYTLKVLFYIGRKDVECGLTFTVAPAPLTDSMVTLDETKVTYNGAEQKPALTVKQGDNTLTPETDYEVSYSRDKVATTDFTNAGTVTITIKGKGNYEGEIKKTYTIAPAELTIKANDQTIFFGQSIAAGADNTTVTGLCNGDRLESVTLTPSTGNVPGGRITPYGAVITNGEDQDVTGDYAITYQTGTLTISYMERPENILYNHEERKNCYGRSEVVISADGYTVSDAQNGEYKDSFIIPVPARTGTVTKTLYFSKDGGKSAGVEVTVNFDLTPPTGKVKVGAKWWETLLKTITFGHYAVKEYTVTIESNDTGGSKIGEIQYAILYDDEQYTNASELASAAGIPWTEYDSDSKPKVPVGSRCVVYARLTDQAGNVTYISTEGILLDETPPAVGVMMGTVEAQTAEFIITLDEAADYYYVVLPGSAGAPEAENIIAGGTAVTGSAASGRGEVKEGQLTGGKATVNVTASNLTPGMEYTVYVTAVDKTVDLETGAAAGNIQKEVKAVSFTMKKLTQAAPILSYQADRTDENNVKITITPIDGAEYKFGDGDWGSENEKAGFTTSDTVKLAIRLKETDTHYQSSPQTITVDLSKEDRKAPSAFSLKVVANGETDYTVTIPLTEGCEYSFDGETWSDVNVKTGVKVGETVTGYMRYKATDQYNTSIAVKGSATMPKFTGKTPVIPPAEENYEKQSGGSGGENSGSSGNTTPVIPVIPPAINANPGTEPVKTGTGNTEKPGTGMRPGSGTGTPAQGTKQPFIKGEDGKIGWDVIRAEEEQAQEGSTINVDMNGSVVVPGDIFDSIKGKDITITFDMGSGILWSVDGKSITTDKAGDIDFSVKTETNAIPVDIVNNVTGERYSIQISLSYDGEFGFTAVLSIGLGRENEGYTASLYYYNESTGELEFICADTVAEDGTVSLAFTHASDYVIVIDGDEEESGMGETVQQTSAGTDENTGNVPESPKTGQKKKNVLWPIVAGIVALAGIAFAGVLAWKKKEENSSVNEDKQER